MVERDKLRELEQNVRRGRELNPDLPGERPMSYPLDHEDLIQKAAYFSGFELYFTLETRAKSETLPSKGIIMANLIYIALHVGKGKKPYKCTICDKNFQTRRHVKVHIEEVHEKKKPFSCVICDYKCARDSNLKQHIVSVHEEKKPFNCMICNHQFARVTNLKRHVDQVHEKKKLFSCTICGFKCGLKCNLEKQGRR